MYKSHSGEVEERVQNRERVCSLLGKSALFMSGVFVWVCETADAKYISKYR